MTSEPPGKLAVIHHTGYDRPWSVVWINADGSHEYIASYYTEPPASKLVSLLTMLEEFDNTLRAAAIVQAQLDAMRD
jgi:hypothetical protein